MKRSKKRFEEMTAEDEEALKTALKEHREGKTITFRASKPRTRKR